MVGNLLLGLLGSLFLVFSVALYRTLDAPTVGEDPPEARGTAAWEVRTGTPATGAGESFTVSHLLGRHGVATRLYVAGAVGASIA